MGIFIPRFLRFDGYETIDIQTSTKQKSVTVMLDIDKKKSLLCHVCDSPMKRVIHTKIRRVKDLEIRGFVTRIVFPRRTGECEGCRKQRVEKVSFLSSLSPHYTKEYAWWLGEMCEFAPVKRAASFCNIDNMTLRRIDLNRMVAMAKQYRIPIARRISVDEVYARKKGKKRESRNKKFFTVITDLDTRKVIWITETRDKAGLDEFFSLIGPASCSSIDVIAMDQHDAYKASAREFCPRAVVVWDRFHLMQSFNEAANELRKDVFEYANKKSDLKRLTQGKFRYIFLKKASRRRPDEKVHLEEVMKDNWYLSRLEVIKERFFQFFNEDDVEVAWKAFDEIGDWVEELGYPPLIRWWQNLERNWDTLKNFFSFKVTTALSEGINNVIKSIKRQAYGFRNMDYFRLKIMQRCGYLNSQHIPSLDFC